MSSKILRDLTAVVWKTSRYIWHPAVTGHWADSHRVRRWSMALLSSPSWRQKVHYLLQPQRQHKWCMSNAIDCQKRAAPPRAFFICRVPTLVGNRRQSQALTDCYANNTSIIQLSGTTHTHRHTSVFASWLWNTTGRLSLHSLSKHAGVTMGPPSYPLEFQGQGKAPKQSKSIKSCIGWEPYITNESLVSCWEPPVPLLRGIIQVKRFYSSEFNKSCGNRPGCLSHPYLFERVMSLFLMVRPSLLQKSLAGRSFPVYMVISVPWLHGGLGWIRGKGVCILCRYI